MTKLGKKEFISFYCLQSIIEKSHSMTGTAMEHEAETRKECH